MKEADYRKKIVTIGHVWFADHLYETKTDIAMFHGMNDSCLILGLGKYQNISKQSTLISDLSQDDATLWNVIKKNTKYEIRRAEKEGVTAKYYLGEELPEEMMVSFEQTYNQMYSSKGMSTVFNRELVGEYCKKSMIAFSIASYQDEPLVFHSYIFDDLHCRFYYSCSPFRDEKDMATLIGRMNRYLHWMDFKYFKGMGIREYDWGGINSIDEPNSIAQFKMAFGGTPVDRYNYIVGNSVKGRIAFLLKYRK